MKSPAVFPQERASHINQNKKKNRQKKKKKKNTQKKNHVDE